MNIDIVRKHSLSKKGTSEDFPFDEDTLVFRVGKKMFALISVSEPFSINLKCDPELAVELREKYDAVTPGFHMNKAHWNTVNFDGSIPDKEILEMIDHSYNLIFASLPKKIKLEIGEGE
jgi:predicted DNA-binding protein (MmcQ/YjbR family)